MYLITMRAVVYLRRRDVLYALTSVGDLPVPNSIPPHSNKRGRNAEIPSSTLPTGGNVGPTPSLSADTPRSIAGSSRVKESIRQFSLPTEPAEPLGMYTLPVHSTEFVHLPVHGEAAFPPQSQYQVPAPDINFPHGSPSTGSMQHYSSTDQPLSSMDDLVINSMGSNYNTFVGESFWYSSSSFGTTHSAESGSHQIGLALRGAGMPGLMNAHADATDADANAMWSVLHAGWGMSFLRTC